MKKYEVEKKYSSGAWLHYGEYQNIRLMAQDLKYSPAKLKMALDDMNRGEWNRLGDYRIVITDK